MYKNNSGLIAKIKVSKHKKGLCFTEKLVHFIRYYSYTNRWQQAKKQSQTKYKLKSG